MQSGKRLQANDDPEAGPSSGIKRPKKDKIPSGFSAPKFPVEEFSLPDEIFDIPEAEDNSEVLDLQDASEPDFPKENTLQEEIAKEEEIVKEEEFPKYIDLTKDTVLKVVTGDVPVHPKNNNLVVYQNLPTTIIANEAPANKTNVGILEQKNDENKEIQIMQLTQGQNSNETNPYLIAFQREQQLALARAQRLLDEQELEKMRMKLFDKVLDSRK